MADNAGNRTPNEGGPYQLTGQLFSGSTVRSLGEQLVLQSLFEAKEAAEELRVLDAERRVDVYEDDWTSLLRQRLARSFEPANAEDLFRVIDTSNNPLKRIIVELSNMYARPPRWRFAVANPLWREIEREANCAVIKPELNRMVNLLNTSFLYVRPNARGWLAFHLALACDVRIWQDPEDPARPLTVAFRQGNVNTPGEAPLWHVWSRGPGEPFYALVDAGGNVRKRMRNEYANEDGSPAIPLVAYHRKWPTWSFWDQTTGDDLYELTILLGMWETWLNHLMRTDSIRQKWAAGIVDVAGTQVGGTTSILQVRNPQGGPVALGEFSSQADWSGLGNQATRKLQNVLNSHGMSIQDYMIGGDVQSGFSLKVRKEGLMELREQQAPLYETWDRDLYATCAAVWNLEIENPRSGNALYGKDPLPWPSEARPEIRYGEFRTLLTVEEKLQELELRKQRIALGLESVEDLYLEEHPDATLEEATAAIAANQARGEAMMPEMKSEMKAEEQEGMDDGEGHEGGDPGGSDHERGSAT